mmetsp:Transcript_73230/g.238165  ORF Transcript_73230/g.238165 Transcript_73230/m.238165 type:complete len:392 (+) Transcript_73230:111-1286(+)
MLALLLLLVPLQCCAANSVALREVVPYASAGSGTEDPLGAFGAAALLSLPSDGLAVASFGAGLWVLELATPHIRARRHRSVLSPGHSATSLASLPGGCLAVGGDGVRLVNTSTRSANFEGTSVSEISGVNALLASPSPGIGLAIGADSGLHLLGEDAVDCSAPLLTRSANSTLMSNDSDLQNESVAGMLSPGLLPGRFVYALVQLPSGEIVAGTDDGIWILSRLDVKVAPSAVLAPGSHVASLLPLPGGGLVAGTLNGALIFRSQDLRPGGRPRATLAKGSAIWGILLLPDDDGLLLGTSSWSAGSKDRGALLFSASAWQSTPPAEPSVALSAGAVVWALALLPHGGSGFSIGGAGGASVVVGGSRGVELFDLADLRTKVELGYASWGVAL